MSSPDPARPIDHSRIRDLSRQVRRALLRIEEAATKADPQWRREVAMELCEMMLWADGVVGTPLDLASVRIIEPRETRV